METFDPLVAERWMRRALERAREAAAAGDVPVGAVVVCDGEVLGEGCNEREATGDPTAHAEVVALRRAAARVGRWRLDGATLYVTLEPCAMCAGAMVNSRLSRLVYGCTDPRAGAAGSVLNLTDFPGMLHRVQVKGGVLTAECQALLQEFFRLRRQEQKGRVADGEARE